MAANPSKAKARWRDLVPSFGIHPVSGDLSTVTNEQAVRRAVWNLLKTGRYERVDDPAIGSRLNEILFEPMDGLSRSSLRNEIEKTIKNYEPRISSLAVTVTPDEMNNRYLVTVIFRISSMPDAVVIETFLERVR